MMIKRLLCLILAVLCASALAACGDDAADVAPTASETAAADTAAPTDPESTGSETPDPTLAPAAQGMDLAAFIRTFDRTPQLAEQVICDSNGVKITAVGLRYDPISGPAVRFRAESAAERTKAVRADTCAVNGYMMPVSLSLTLRAGEKTEGEMFIPYSSLALAGVEKLATVELSLELTDPDSFKTLTSLEPVVMQTTAADYEQTYDDEGQKIFDEKGVCIVLKGIDRARQISEYPALIVYMVNDSDRCVSVQAETLLVNGYELTPAMTATVLPGKHAVDVVAFFDMDLDEYDIEEIETVEISFRIVDEKTWETIAQTKTVPVDDV